MGEVRHDAQDGAHVEDDRRWLRRTPNRSGARTASWRVSVELWRFATAEAAVRLRALKGGREATEIEAIQPLRPRFGRTKVVSVAPPSAMSPVRAQLAARDSWEVMLPT